ncbi:MAG TPA: aldose 1-epimerase family protein [Actinomycetes bacterium]|nr:aldose 1-epimerase family protein [Actinomycetes bacterium]
MSHPQTSLGSPSGQQYVIASGDYSASVTEVGGGLRELLFESKDVLDGFSVDDRAHDGRGQVLAPWPNRLSEGRYAFDGRSCQAALNEPSRQNAIHGLVRWVDWTPTSHDAASVSVTCTLRPQPAYEWQLRMEVTYQLGADGLTVSTRVVNQSDTAAPFGVGFHPYLTVSQPIDGLSLRLPASGYLVPSASADALPVTTAVAATELDFTQARNIGSTVLDTAYTLLERDSDGRAVAQLRDPTTDRSVRLWVDDAYQYLMVYTGDGVHDPARRRMSVAVEPMTCPPNAFRNGVDVLRLEPNEEWRGSWGLVVDS